MNLKLKLIVILFVMFVLPWLIMMYTVLIAGSTFSQTQWEICWLFLGIGLISSFIIGLWQ